MKLTSPSSHVVMVDDNEADVYLARMCCARSRLTNPWLSFSSGAKFLEYVGKVRDGRAPMPGLVLLDINMPRMSGLEVLEQLRADPFFQKQPSCCLFTSSGDPRDRATAERLGATDFLTKFASVAEYVEFFDSLVATDPK